MFYWSHQNIELFLLLKFSVLSRFPLIAKTFSRASDVNPKKLCNCLDVSDGQKLCKNCLVK